MGELLDCAGIATVALDDLHFADAATLELLSGLAAVESPAAGCWPSAQPKRRHRAPRCATTCWRCSAWWS